MRVLVLLVVCTALGAAGCSQKTKTVQMGALEDKEVEAGCAMCIYDMEGVVGCKPAVVIDGQTMLVTGVVVDLHEFGLCSAPHDGVVSGTIEEDTVVATSLEIK